jgi:fluoride exporter
VTRPHPLRPTLLLAVAAGGAVGACARWLLGEWFPIGDGAFPWTTFAINVVGCALLALLPASALVRRHPVLPPALGTGVLGGFTTLSAYSEESRALLAAGHTSTASAYLLGTLATCLLAVALVDRVNDPADRADFEAEEEDL